MIKPFKKFGSITLLHLEKEEELLHFRMAFGDTRCVVTEKVHGSNFQVAHDGIHTKFGRRGAFLKADESFNGYQYIEANLTARITAMFKDVKEMVMEQHKVCDELEAEGLPSNRPSIPRDFQELSIRGEFAGGNYPAEGVPVVKNGHGHVGKGSIWYSQDKSFYAFELCIDGVVQDFYTMASLCSSFGIPVVPVLFFGTLDECIEYSKEHLNENTTVPTMQPMLDENNKPIMDGDYFTSLPVIPNNTREGHVIEPLEPMYFRNGKVMKLKHKGTKFMEDKGGKRPKAKPVLELTDDQNRVYDALLPLLTWERFEAVQSKHDLFTPKEFGKACGLVLQDAIDEVMSFNDGFSLERASWEALTAKERKAVTKPLGRECTLRLRTQFFN